MSKSLLIDIGHTRLKYVIVDTADIDTNNLSCAKEIAYKEKNINECLNNSFAAQDYQQVYLSCVAGSELSQAVINWFEKKSKACHLITSSEASLNIKSAYAKAQTLGSDRWLAMIAAFEKYATAVCVVDCGSAVTLDVVDSTGQHQGGLIMPGVHSMHSSLSHSTTLVDADIFSFENTELNLGKNTSDCINYGVLRSIASLIETEFARLQLLEPSSNGPNGAKCILSGGDAKLISSQLKCEHELESNLVLKGLAKIVAELDRQDLAT